MVLSIFLKIVFENMNQRGFYYFLFFFYVKYMSQPFYDSSILGIPKKYITNKGINIPKLD